MQYEAINYEIKNGYGIITLNRPERLNAIGKQMVTEIVQIVEEVSVSNEVNALVFTGSGSAHRTL